MSSIKEIAKQVGISPASVSIYLNNKDTNRVSSATKEKIEQAVKELNYRKNIFASSLSTKESKLIGIIIPTILPLFENDYTNALLAGIQTRLSSFGYGLLFFPSSARSSMEIVKEQLEKSAGCDGYILFSTGFCSMNQILKNISEVRKTEKPFVTMNIPRVDDNINQVIIEDLDTVSGARYLINRGHRKLILVLGRKKGEYARFLLQDYRKALSDSGISFDPERIVYGEYSAETAYANVRDALNRFPDTTGICCMSDIMALASLKAAGDGGRSVPGDISVIGRNNSIHSRFSSPALTTIDLHMNKAGLSAADLLLENLSGNSMPGKIILAGSLVERESVRDA